MTSLAKDRKPGSWRVVFTASDGRRRSIGLGKISQRQAESFHRHVEAILSAGRIGTTIAIDTAGWLSSMSDAMHNKLVRVGLIEGRQTAALGVFLSDYVSMRRDVKPVTRQKYETTVARLVEYFGSDRLIGDISAGIAHEWRLSMFDDLSENTVRRHTSTAFMFFEHGRKRRLIQENPFAGMPTATMPNPERSFL